MTTSWDAAARAPACAGSTDARASAGGPCARRARRRRGETRARRPCRTPAGTGRGSPRSRGRRVVAQRAVEAGRRLQPRPGKGVDGAAGDERVHRQVHARGLVVRGLVAADDDSSKCPSGRPLTLPVLVTAREVDASRNAPGRSGSGPETSARTAKSWRQAWALPTKRVRTRRIGRARAPHGRRQQVAQALPRRAAATR